MAYPYPPPWQDGGSAAISSATPRMHIPSSRDDKILPKPGQQNVLVTSALPYSNNHPHLGNIIGSTLSADVYARYSRNRNRNTLYICGTDEYGTATETKALEDGVTPQELCDKYHALHRKAYTWFEIGFDHFGRTTTPQQTEIAQDIFLKLHANGYLEEKAVTQLYCETDKRFLADRYVEGVCPKCGYEDARGDQCDKCGQLLDAIELIKPRCKTCASTPVQRESKHMFIRIDTLQSTTETWAREAAAKGHWSANGRQITENWFKEGLRPFSLTRDLKWGVPVPLDGLRDKVLYVWFDAPIGYPSITANYTDQWEQWWKRPEDVKLYQFMGKDNVRFHTVIFPSCLLGTKESWTMLDSISTTEYLQYEGGKFSKSRNVGVFADKASDVGLPPSVWRYYLLANRPETADSQFVWADFVQRNNSELVANLGNFVNRVLSFMKKYDHVVPALPDAAAHAHGLELEKGLASEAVQGPYATFVRDVNALLAQYTEAMDTLKLRTGLQLTMALSARGNLFLTESGLDNALYNNERAKCDTVLLLAINLIYTLSALVHPFMPSAASAMLEQLHAPARALEEGKPLFGLYVLPGHRLGTPAHLFKRIEEKMVDVWRAQFGGPSSSAAKAGAAADGAVPVGPDGKPLSKKQLEKAAKAAKKAAAAASASSTGLSEDKKTDEYRALEEAVKVQGDKVRAAKAAGSAEGAGAAVEGEVQELLRLKKEMGELAARLEGASLSSS